METTPKKTLQSLKNKKNITKKDLQELLLVSGPMIWNVLQYLPIDMRDDYEDLSTIMAHCFIKSK